MKMRSLLAACAVFLSCVVVSSSALAIEADDFRRPFEKLGRGTLNTVLSPMELVNVFVRETSRYLEPGPAPQNIVEYTLTTPVIAVGYTVMRCAFGVAEVVTFPIPFGSRIGYGPFFTGKPLSMPEYVPPFYSKENWAQ